MVKAYTWNSPPNGVITMVSTLSTKTHRTLHHEQTDETMVRASCLYHLDVARSYPPPQIPIFERDPDGSSPKSKYIMGRRNWCSVKWDPQNGDLVWDIRVEIQKGNGQTSGCVPCVSSCADCASTHVLPSDTSSAPRRLAGTEYIRRYCSPTTESCMLSLKLHTHYPYA